MVVTTQTQFVDVVGRVTVVHLDTRAALGRTFDGLVHVHQMDVVESIPTTTMTATTAITTAAVAAAAAAQEYSGVWNETTNQCSAPGIHWTR